MSSTGTDPHFITNKNGKDVIYYRNQLCSIEKAVSNLLDRELLIPDKTYNFSPEKLPILDETANPNYIEDEARRNNSIKLEDYKSLKLVTHYKMIKCDDNVRRAHPKTESITQQILKQNPNFNDYTEISYFDEYVTVYKNVAVLLIEESNEEVMDNLICGFFLQSYFSKLQDKPNYIKIANIREFGFLYTKTNDGTKTKVGVYSIIDAPSYINCIEGRGVMKLYETSDSRYNNGEDLSKAFWNLLMATKWFHEQKITFNIPDSISIGIDERDPENFVIMYFGGSRYNANAVELDENLKLSLNSIGMLIAKKYFVNGNDRNGTFAFSTNRKPRYIQARVYSGKQSHNFKIIDASWEWFRLNWMHLNPNSTRKLTMEEVIEMNKYRAAEQTFDSKKDQLFPEFLPDLVNRLLQNKNTLDELLNHIWFHPDKIPDNRSRGVFKFLKNTFNYFTGTSTFKTSTPEKFIEPDTETTPPPPPSNGGGKPRKTKLRRTRNNKRKQSRNKRRSRRG